MNLLKASYRFTKKNLPSMFKTIQTGPKIQQSQEFKQIKKLFSETNREKSVIEALQENYLPKEIYKQIDTNLEVYFQRRPYDTNSFNFLICALTAQDKVHEIESILQLMEKLKISKNRQTYTLLIQGYGKKADFLARAEKFFNVARNKFGDSIYLFNSLIHAYSTNYMPEKAYKVFLEMQRLGMQADVTIYTTLINAFYRGKQYAECWRLFDDVRMGKSTNPPDENLLGLMIEISADTHDAEKAVWIYDMMDEMEHKESTIVFNAMIKALGSRTDYAERALEYYRLMQMKNIPIDSDTIVCTLKACSKSGDVKTAVDVIKTMNERGIQANKYIYNLIIRVYSGACNLETVDIDLCAKYVEDAWKIFNEAAAKQMVTQWTLNSMCDLMVSVDRLADLEGLVLPLFDQFNIEKNAYTYEALVRVLHNQKRILDVYDQFDKVKKQFTPTFKTICCYIEAAIMAADEERVIEALEWFNKIDRIPKYRYLSQLANVPNLPVRIHAILNEYETKFGTVKSKIYKAQNSNEFKLNL